MARARGKNPGRVVESNPTLDSALAADLAASTALSRSERLLLTGLLICLAGIVIAVHWPVLSAQARSFDDHEFLTDNHLVRNPGWPSVARFFGEVLEPSTVQGYYIPLTMVSLMVDYAGAGTVDDLRPFHRTSLALHVANCLLLVVLLYILFRNPWAAAAAGLLFGLHPLTVEPVAWLAERKTLLSTFFAVLSLVLYAGYGRRGGRGLLGGSAAAYLLSLLAKPTGLLLPIALLLLDCWPLRRLGRRTMLEKWPFYLVATIGAAITLISHARTASVQASGGHLLTVPLAMGYLTGFYLGKVVWPVDLSSVYAMPEPLSLVNPAMLAAIGVAVMVSIAVFWRRRQTPALIIGWAIFLIMILPTLGVVRYSWVRASDKYVYLPAVGLLVPLVWGIARFVHPAARAQRSRGIGVLVIVVVLAALETRATRGYLDVWQDSESLARHMVEVAPTSPYAHAILARTLADAGKSEEAIAGYLRALELDPNHVDAHYNFAVMLAEQGRADEAIEHYRAALRGRPRSVRAHNNLANLLAHRGLGEDALSHYMEALRLRPEAPETRYNLANLLTAMGRPDMAVEHYRAAAALAPGRPETWNNLGMALGRTRDLQGAVAAYRESVRLDPAEPSTHYNLGNTLSNLGRAEEAVAAYERCLQLQPGYASAQNNLANALLKLGRPDAAITHFRECLRIEPGHTRARLNLARTLEQADHRDEAIAEYEALLRVQPDHQQARQRFEVLTGRPATTAATAPSTQPGI